MQHTTDQRLTKIEAILKNGISESVKENKRTIQKLDGTATHLDVAVQNLQDQSDKSNTRITQHFDKIYNKIDSIQQALSAASARLDGKNEKLWHKTILIALAIMAALSTIDYVIKIIHPDAPDMHLLAFFIDMLKALK